MQITHGVRTIIGLLLAVTLTSVGCHKKSPQEILMGLYNTPVTFSALPSGAPDPALWPGFEGHMVAGLDSAKSYAAKGAAMSQILIAGGICPNQDVPACLFALTYDLSVHGSDDKQEIVLRWVFLSEKGRRVEGYAINRDAGHEYAYWTREGNAWKELSPGMAEYSMVSAFAAVLSDQIQENPQLGAQRKPDRSKDKTVAQNVP